MIRVDNITKSYDGQMVLQDFSATFDRGINCITGPSGCGKTTLLRLIMGLERPDSGSILRDSSLFSAVFQEDRLFSHMNASDNLRYALGKDFDSGKAEEILARLLLENADDKPVRDYSGGMKRRLAIARAVLRPADIYIFDEPFTGIDKEAGTRALDLIKSLSDHVVILVTHQREEADYLGHISYTELN